ncbi:restriction endonuclease [Aliarcobacter butzleri]|uniref:restriction endonuclease n=1 Tax=Aliarcobacter butzleri TaxID=28197 RepID=UPI0021B29903|nr:restriction endonuclease [Aliarcobacter butzleri]MCT7583085.1 restriction endonuclease [Aliarcobacter butzleri]
MNYWTQLSSDFANQRNYLDELFRIYPTIPDGIRDIDNELWKEVEVSYNKRDNTELIKKLLKFDLFPIKDSYVAYLKRDKSSIERNPQTINRLSGRLYEMGLDKIYEKCSEPKETNRQIGPLFKRWIDNGGLGILPVKKEEFIKSDGNAILSATDDEMKKFAKEFLNYDNDKGLDFISRFNGKYIIGEAKFLTDFGGHQNAQYNDAMATLNSKTDAITIAILDGVLYIPSKNRTKMNIDTEKNIMSALVLREFLYQV